MKFYCLKGIFFENAGNKFLWEFVVFQLKSVTLVALYTCSHISFMFNTFTGPRVLFTVTFIVLLQFVPEWRVYVLYSLSHFYCLIAVRNRMKSVKNIQKITKAMKMVAASKLRAIQVRAENSRGLWQPFTALLGDTPSMFLNKIFISSIVNFKINHTTA